MLRRASSSLATAVSRKVSLFLFSVSMVKRMEGCWLFRCCKKSSTFSRSRMVKNEVKFIDRDPHYYTRRVKEAIQIRLHPDNINRDSGIEIPEAWMPTI